jgi:hypothetical protein
VEQQSLYERLDGVNAIAMVVDRFSDAIVENRSSKETGSQGMERVRPVGRLCQQADGELDEVGAEIGRALDDLNMPERERQEVFAAIVARKDEVVHQPQ